MTFINISYAFRTVAIAVTLLISWLWVRAESTPVFLRLSPLPRPSFLSKQKKLKNHFLKLLHFAK